MQKYLHQITHIFFTIFIVLLLPPRVIAETRYVSDQLVISVRTGPANSYKLIENIKTGTAMTLLEEKGEYIKVSVGEDLIGWVPKYYTETRIPKEEIIKSLNVELKRMEQEAEKQASKLEELQEIQGTNTQNLARIDTLDKQVTAIQTKYTALLTQSKNAIETTKERDELKKQKHSNDQKLQDLLKENSSLRNYEMIYWFTAGGGIFLLGWLIGKLSQRGNKRSLTL